MLQSDSLIELMDPQGTIEIQSLPDSECYFYMVVFENGAGTKKNKRREDVEEIEGLYIVKIRDCIYVCMYVCMYVLYETVYPGDIA